MRQRPGKRFRLTCRQSFKNGNVTFRRGLQVTSVRCAIQDFEALSVDQATEQHRLNHGHSGSFEQAEVEAAIMLKQGVFVLAQCCDAHALQLSVKIRQEGIIACLDNTNRCTALDVMTDAKKLSCVVRTCLGDMRIAPGATCHKPILRQSHQGLADGPLRAVKAFGQLQFPQGGTRGKRAEHDVTPQGMLCGLAAAALTRRALC